ncbi:unnamed protein product [Onchocerca flexuosa]|uniref:Calmodulin-binding transcription activator 5-like n=1 Tax=Onchocerca flexuosa TaxID=387005 RepID=A0A183HTB2_9BILA|nr:unnamed protein product [Onchocerca flexuosa]
MTENPNFSHILQIILPRCHSINAAGSAAERDAVEDRAATRIQAEIRGFLARRHLQQIKKEGNEAAKKIQAHIRSSIHLFFLYLVYLKISSVILYSDEVRFDAFCKVQLKSS